MMWHFVTFQVRCDAARFRNCFLSTSKNVTIFPELGTNVTISSHHHIIFEGSKQTFKTWPGSRFSNSSLEQPSQGRRNFPRPCERGVAGSDPSTRGSKPRGTRGAIPLSSSFKGGDPEWDCTRLLALPWFLYCLKAGGTFSFRRRNTILNLKTHVWWQEFASKSGVFRF